MMRTALPFLAATLLSTLACGSAAAPATPGPVTPTGGTVTPGSGARDAAQANAFSFAMYGALKNEKGNLFFSGTSLREALGIAYLGARGQTASEMASAMKLDPDRAKASDFARTEITDFAAAKGSANLTIANRLWGDKSYQPKSDFTGLARQAYGAGLDPLDFKAAPDPSRVTINDWVAKQTNDRVKDLLPGGSISTDTRMVITNAIWFKGDWAQAFQTANTRDADFFVDGTTATKAPLMQQTNQFALSRADGAQMLEMRYAKSDIAMDILLPDSKTGLPSLEEKVVANGIGAWTKTLFTQKVDVTFPKVTMTWGAKMKTPLGTLGMKTAFDQSQADLSGIADAGAAGGRLFVSEVFHKAFVAIDEKGTEAAAATAVVVNAATSVLPPTPVFRADHPFIIVIRDTKQDRVLFTGRVVNPRS